MDHTLSKLTERAMLKDRSGSLRLLTPAHFLDLSIDEVDRAARYGRPLSVAIVLINRLSAIRKADGAQTGQDILAYVCHHIQDSIRLPDKFGRLGPSEIGVLLPETPQDKAGIAAARMRDAVHAHPIETDSGLRSISLNVGIAGYSPRMKNAKALLMAACFELRRSRNEGPGAVCVAPGDRVRLSLPRSGKIH